MAMTKFQQMILMSGLMSTRKGNLINELLISFLVIQAVWLVVSLIPGLNASYRLFTLLIFILILIVVFWFRRKNFVPILWFGFATSVLVLTSAGLAKILKPVAHYVLQFLSLGIDNDPHIQMYKEIVKSSGQIKLGYPPGQQATWNLISKLANLSSNDTADIVSAFGALTILTWLLIIFLSSLLILRKTKFNFESFTKIYGLVFIFLFGGFSFMVVGGYPHYMWATVVLLLVANALQETPTFYQKVVVLLVATWILFVTFPVFAATTGLCLVANLLNESRNKLTFNSVLTKKKLNYLVFGIIFIFFVSALWAVKRYTLNWIAADASAEPISVTQIGLTFILLIGIYKFSSINSLQINFELKALIISLALVSVLISLLTLAKVQKVTYFAVKQIQFSLLIILVITLASVLVHKSNWIVKSCIFLLVLVQFIPVLSPKVFDGAIMGSGVKGFIYLTKPNQWDNITFAGNSLIDLSDQVQLKNDECAVFWKPDRVIISKSTWLNAINPNTKIVCQNFAYLELTNSEQEILAAAEKLDQRFLVIYSQTNKPDAAELTSANIRLFELIN